MTTVKNNTTLKIILFLKFQENRNSKMLIKKNKAKLIIRMNHKSRNKAIFKKINLCQKIDHIKDKFNWIIIIKKKSKRKREKYFFKPKCKQTIKTELIISKNSIKNFNPVLSNIKK